jgi:uncharacterized membrane protein YeaQ/YmgE (transglycosylase-associated protein family)
MAVPHDRGIRANAGHISRTKIYSRRREIDMLHILWSIIVGFIVGLVGRALVPGADKMGFLATTVLGILGSLVGGLLGRAISKPQEGSKFHPAGFFLSVVGAIILLVSWRFIR